jgi:hypothetical protein
MRSHLALVAIGGSFAIGACKSAPSSVDPAPTASAASAAASAAQDASTDFLVPHQLLNKVAYIPPQCFTKTRDLDGKANNPCYVCHTRSEPPNFANDEDLQVTFKLPRAAAKNPWTNLFSPPIARAAPTSDDEILRYVRKSNYFDDDGRVALARVLETPLPDWDLNHNGKWDGFVPDVQYAFDEQGFDHRSDGTPTGWRAFAYYPFPGTFFPTNGSADDVLIRLDEPLRENDKGDYDVRIYTVNLAIVEALITRADVAIDPVDESALGVDLDLDGHLGRATRVAFDAAKDGTGDTKMRYVGRAGDLLKKGQLQIAEGLFPLRTEFFHTVRYLDVGADGAVTMATRMKEVRYARKERWMTYHLLKGHAEHEARATAASVDGTHHVERIRELGVSNEEGWYYQGFIEARDGSLRPQATEELAFCEGCHSGIGVTADGTFSFARKLGSASIARGWFHWSKHGLSGIAEPKRQDGQFEYTLYLREAGAGDEFRSNFEVLQRFFDERGALRSAEVERLHSDIARLLLPTAARAMDLDRAYRAVVVEQGYIYGRDVVLGKSSNVFADPPIGQKTGVDHTVVAMRIAR